MRVATLNLFNNEHGRWPDREPLVVTEAVKLDADVYCFQEVATAGGQVERLLDGLGGAFVAVPLDNPDAASIKSLVVITRLAVVEHDSSTALEQGDIALRVRVEAADGFGVDVVTTHFHFEASRAGSECRRRQAEQLLEWLGAPGPPTVVAGDFNSRPTGGAVGVLKRRFRSAYEAAHGREPESTHPTPLLQAIDTGAAFGMPIIPEGGGATIDYVFVSDGIDVDACELAWTTPSAAEPDLYPSDHYGLVASLSVGVGG